MNLPVRLDIYSNGLRSLTLHLLLTASTANTYIKYVLQKPMIRIFRDAKDNEANKGPFEMDALLSRNFF